MNRLLSVAHIQPLGMTLPMELNRSSRMLLRDALHLGNCVMRRASSRIPLVVVSGLQGFSTSPGFVSSNSSLPSGQLPNFFVTHVIYKTKSAMAMRPTKPSFKTLEGSGGFALEREGTLLLDFAPAIGQLQYDWKRKQIFALSVVELGALVGLLPNEGCEFFHDPYVGKSDAGKVRKTLKVDPMPDRSGYFFNFNFVNRIENLDGHVNIPVTRPEFSVMKSAFSFIIPYLMGWHAFAYPSQVDETMLSDHRTPRGTGSMCLDYQAPRGSSIEGGPGLEWARWLTAS